MKQLIDTLCMTGALCVTISCGTANRYGLNQRTGFDCQNEAKNGPSLQLAYDRSGQGLEDVLRQTFERMVQTPTSDASSNDIKNKLREFLDNAARAVDATQAGLYLMDTDNKMTKIRVLPNESATISLKLSGIDFDEEKSYTFVQIHESINYANHEFSIVGHGSSSSSLRQGTGDNEGVYEYTVDGCIKANIGQGFSKVKLIKMYIEEKGDFILEDGIIIGRGPSKMVGNPVYSVMGERRSLFALAIDRISLFGDYVNTN